MKNIIIVDENDQEQGVGEKLEVHQKGILHRAFSLFVMNSKKELLLQKRAQTKYHSGGLWTNTCCSHPKPGIEIEKWIQTRLMEEMGFNCEIKFLFKFAYEVKFANGLIENELDWVYIGFFEDNPVPALEEVSDWKWVDLDWIKEDLLIHPASYTEWFKLIFDRFYKYVR